MIPVKVYNILFDLVPMVILFSIVMITLRIVTLIYAKEKIDIFKELKNLVYIIYLFALFTLVTTTDFESFSNNFVPFKEITRYSFSSPLFYRNVIGNILLFVPFGYVISDMVKEKAKKINILITSIIALVTSATIEFIQMFIGRSFDVDDIILNFIGSIIGFIIFIIYDKLLKKIENKIIRLLTTVLIILIFVIILSICYGVIK